MFDMLIPSSDLAVSTRTRSSCTQSIRMDIGSVNTSSALSFTACHVYSSERPCSTARCSCYAACLSLPCFVYVMQTTTVTTNIVWLVWHMLSRNLLLMGVTYRMELMMTMMMMMMMMYNECECWHDMMTEWDSHQMLLLISMNYCFLTCTTWGNICIFKWKKYDRVH